MHCADQQFFLAAGGAVIEFLGLLVVLWEAVGAEREFRKFGRAARHLVRKARENLRTFDAAAVIAPAQPPSVEQRVATLEREVGEIRDELGSLAVDLPRQMREERADDLNTIKAELEERLSALQKLIGTTVRPPKWRWIGLGLFAIGLALNTWGNLLNCSLS